VTAGLRFGLIELQNRYLAQSETRLAVDGASQLFMHMLRLPVSYFVSPVSIRETV